MSDNFGNHFFIPKPTGSENNVFPNDFVKELLQELFIILSDIEITKFEIKRSEIDKLKNLINNFLFEYDLNSKNVFKIMTSNPQNILCYSSLIGIFYQYGIGCYVDKTKAFEIFSNAVNNDQKNETINDDTEKLNKIILQYFYSLFYYKDVILYTLQRKNNFGSHIRNAEKGDNVSQYYIGNCYYHGKSIKRDYNKAIEWYSKSSSGGNIRAVYKLGIYYDYGYGVTKDEKKAFEIYLKSAKEAGI